jgi:hypothetical protein
MEIKSFPRCDISMTLIPVPFLSTPTAATTKKERCERCGARPSVSEPADWLQRCIESIVAESADQVQI